jgi:hypothetical protein
MKTTTTSTVYVPIANAENITERVGHFVLWHSKVYPGVKILVRNIAKAVFQVRRVSPSNIEEIIHCLSNLERHMLDKYSVGWDYTKEDGGEVLSNAQDIVAKGLTRKVRRVSSAKRSAEAYVALANKHGGKDKCDEEAGAFLDSVTKQIARISLPDAPTIEGRLLTK